MIFPDRVFGSESVKRISSGRAIGLSGQMHGATLLDAAGRVADAADPLDDALGDGELARRTGRGLEGHLGSPCVGGGAGHSTRERYLAIREQRLSFCGNREKGGASAAGRDLGARRRRLASPLQRGSGTAIVRRYPSVATGGRGTVPRDPDPRATGNKPGAFEERSTWEISWIR